MQVSEDTRREIETFFASYSAAFWRNDSDSIVDHFIYPCHIVSDAEPVSQLPIANAQDCRKAVERVLSWHHDIGAVSSRTKEFVVSELSPRLAVVSLKSDFLDRGGQPLYDFHGFYTLVRALEVWKLAAISHNQIPRLLSCLSNTKAR